MNQTPPFIHDDFLLENEYSRELYHEYASKMPIIDYHCHLNPKDIAEDTIFGNITKVWIAGDHYKWRAMRTLGVPEEFITGNADDVQKFLRWAASVPYTMRNPLYHWTHLELARYFDIYELLNKDTAETIYHKTADHLSSKEFSCQKLIAGMNVEVVCTTEDPVDSLEHHIRLAGSGFSTKVSTAFRPDRALMIQSSGYNDYLDELAAAAGSGPIAFPRSRSRGPFRCG